MASDTPGVEWLLANQGAYRLSLDRPFWALHPAGLSDLADGAHHAGMVLLAPSADVTVEGEGVLRHAISLDEGRMAQPAWQACAVRPWRLSVTLRAAGDGPLASVRVVPPVAAPADSLLPLTAQLPLNTDWHTLPDAANWIRTSGPGANREAYVLGGVNTAQKVSTLIDAHLGGAAAGPLRILDWGVGCGRVAVPMKRLIRPRDDVFGVDVDAFNVDWCRRSLHDIPVTVSALYPPLDLAADSVDVVYGISVMTHLRTSTQRPWLRELKRVLRPGGLCIVSVHGDHSLLERKPPESIIKALRSRGISDDQRDDAIKLDESGYYRSTFQLRQQVEAAWSEVMPIVAYLPMANAMVQDYVVLRKA